MIFSMDPFTLGHAVISLVGIAAGLVFLAGMLAGKDLRGWTVIFLLFTVLASVTGFFFKRDHLLPSHIVAGLSLVDLAIALYARYGRMMVGGWRTVIVVTATIALYLNVFVLIVQSFLKLPATPVIGGPLFGAVQSVALLVFVMAGFSAVKRYKTKMFYVAPRI